MHLNSNYKINRSQCIDIYVFNLNLQQCRIVYRHCDCCNKLFKFFLKEHQTQHDVCMGIDQTLQISRFDVF